MSWDYFWRGVQVVGGAAEVAGGVVVAAGGSIFTAGMGSPVAIAGGGAIALHGLDQIQAGLRGTQSVASQAGGAAVSELFGPEYAWIGEIAGDIGPGVGGLAKSIKNLPKLVSNLTKASGPALAKAVSILREQGALKQVLQKLSPSKLKEMLKNKLITKEELVEAGIDPNDLDGGAKSSKSPPSSGETVDLELKYKEGWSEAQREAARKKVQALSEADTKVTSAQRSGTSASTRYKQSGGEVPAGYDVDHIQDLQLGGIDDVTNMSPLDKSVNRSLGSQIHHKIKNLPEGTHVDNVTIVDR